MVRLDHQGAGGETGTPGLALSSAPPSLGGLLNIHEFISTS